MDINDVKVLADAMYKRDSADFGFDAMVSESLAEYKLKQPSGNPELDGMILELIGIVGDVLRMVGPNVFRAGYDAGLAAGMEIAREIRR